MNLKTFEIRIKNSKDKNYLKNYIFKYRHWQNILTIFAINLLKSNNKDYKDFLDYAIIRACVADTKGDKKKQERIAYIKDKYRDNELYQELLKVAKELKTHNLVEIVKRLKKDFSNYFKILKDYKKNPSKYRGLPQLPKAKKKNQIGINLNKKMRCFYLVKNNFHKLSKKIIEYLQLDNVTHLVISSSLAKLKNNGNCNLRKSVKPCEAKQSLF